MIKFVGGVVCVNAYNRRVSLILLRSSIGILKAAIA
jgi:hypothetical protein